MVVDAWLFGKPHHRSGRRLQVSQGETIKHPLGFDIKIDTPIDFCGRDRPLRIRRRNPAGQHTGFAISKLPAAQPLIMKAEPRLRIQRVFIYGVTVLMGGPPVKALMNPKMQAPSGRKPSKIADQYYKPGKFTTFARTNGRRCRTT